MNSINTVYIEHKRKEVTGEEKAFTNSQMFKEIEEVKSTYIIIVLWLAKFENTKEDRS